MKQQFRMSELNRIHCTPRMWDVEKKMQRRMMKVIFVSCIVVLVIRDGQKAKAYTYSTFSFSTFFFY